MGIVYAIRNKVNGKVYVGMTRRTFEERYSGGRWYDYTHNLPLKKSAKKYGVENFEVEILAKSDSDSELARLEMRFIAELGSLDPRKGFNLVIDRKLEEYQFLPEETIKQHKENFSKMLKKRYSDDEYRKKLSKSLKESYISHPERKSVLSVKSKKLHNEPKHKEFIKSHLAKNRADLSWKIKVKEGIKTYHENNKEEFAKKNSSNWTEERREKARQRMLERAKNPEYIEKQRNNRLKYIQENRDKVLETMKNAHTDKQKQKAREILLKRNADPEFQKMATNRAAMIRAENYRRKLVGLTKMTKEEAKALVAKRE